MSLIGVLPSALLPCDVAGGAAPLRNNSLDAHVPTWSPQVWKEGSLVKTQTAPGQPWVIWLATTAHSGAATNPTVNPAGWLALSANPTQVPLWARGTSYQGSSPVRIDDGKGGSTVYVASKVIANSTNSPDTAAGRADGWMTVAGGGPTITTSWSTGAAGAPSTTNPPNPQEGDKFINYYHKISWTYADDPSRPGVNLMWLREAQVLYRTNGPVTITGAAGSQTATFTGTQTEPDPAVFVPLDGDVVFEHQPTTNQLLRVLYL